jgi:hypothetical protein
MYKPTKLQQKLFNHIRKDHKDGTAGFVRPDCKICRDLSIKIQNDSQVNV